MMINSITGLIITYNEEENIARTLSALQWLNEIVIVDSGSNDMTLDIIRGFPNTRLVQRDFDSFANQCNYGLKNIESDWVLSLDADYVLGPEIVEEILSLFYHQAVGNLELASGYRISFRYCINGKPLRSGLLPPRVCLYKKAMAHYVNEGHGHRVSLVGDVRALTNKIFHDDRKGIDIWLDNQKKYQKIEASMLMRANSMKLPIQDKIRKHTFLAPFIAFFYCIFFRGGLLDGKEGIIYALQRVVAESLLFLNMHYLPSKKGSSNGQFLI